MNHVDICERIARDEAEGYLRGAAVRAGTISPEDAPLLKPFLLKFMNAGSSKVVREAQRAGYEDKFPYTADAALVVDIAYSAMMRRAERECWSGRPELLLFCTPVHDSGTCAAAMKYDGKLFSQAEAPLFPLPQCKKPHCRCTFIAGTADMFARWRQSGTLK